MENPPLDGEPPMDGEPPGMENSPKMENPPKMKNPPWMENPPRMENPPGWRTPPRWRTPPTVNVRAVRILLECILVVHAKTIKRKIANQSNKLPQQQFQSSRLCLLGLVNLSPTIESSRNTEHWQCWEFCVA